MGRGVSRQDSLFLKENTRLGEADLCPASPGKFPRFGGQIPRALACSLPFFQQHFHPMVLFSFT